MKAPNVKVKVEWQEHTTQPEARKAFDKGALFGFICGIVLMACIWTAAGQK